MRDILIEYRKKLQNLDEKECILRDLYLREIALGKIQGPLTGFPSIDKVHLAFFKQQHIDKPLPYMTATEYLREQNKNNLSLIAIDCKEGLISYGELFNAIDKTTLSLHNMGVKKGNLIVGMFPADTPHEVYLLYGACQAGSAVSFIVQKTPNDTICKAINDFPTKYYFVSNDDFSLDMEEYIYKNTNIKNIINVSQNPLPHKNRRTISWQKFIEIGFNYQMPKINRSPYDLLLMAKTGGSTGEPKNVMINENGFNIMVHQLLNSELNYNVGDKWLRVWPLFSASAAISSSHLALCAGMINVLRVMPEPQEFAKMFMKEKPNHLCLVTALIDLLIYSGIKREDIQDFVKTAGVGGESITPQFEERAEKFLPDYLGYGYGCMENSSSAVLRMNKGTTIKGKIGILYVKTIVSVFDSESFEEKSYNEEGEICIQSYTQMIGYYHDEQLTHEVLRKHDDGSVWIHTGDLGIIDKKGFITVTGRIKRIISVYSGEKVYPVQLEGIISKVLGVIKVSVIKAPDKDHEEYYVPVACVVIDKKYNIRQVSENIISACEEALPDYAWPQEIIIKDDFPYLASGKPELKAMEREIEEKLVGR
ncbi:MAG: acyl--CoA ligase [Lachnospiraceae bacterium]|nr:acyl--CoA ligase [Lachnospiraceae bacterium]